MAQEIQVNRFYSIPSNTPGVVYVFMSTCLDLVLGKDGSLQCWFRGVNVTRQFLPAELVQLGEHYAASIARQTPAPLPVKTSAPKRYSIDSDTGESSDDGLWRSYQLVTEGDSFDDLRANAHIFEIDQDGGEAGDHPLDWYSSTKLEAACLELIQAVLSPAKETA